MPKINQSERYKKTDKEVEKEKLAKKEFHLKNWQKIIVVSTLTIFCIAAIVTIVYLTVLK